MHPKGKRRRPKDSLTLMIWTVRVYHTLLPACYRLLCGVADYIYTARYSSGGIMNSRYRIGLLAATALTCLSMLPAAAEARPAAKHKVDPRDARISALEAEVKALAGTVSELRDAQQQTAAVQAQQATQQDQIAQIAAAQQKNDTEVAAVKDAVNKPKVGPAVNVTPRRRQAAARYGGRAVLAEYSRDHAARHRLLPAAQGRPDRHRSAPQRSGARRFGLERRPDPCAQAEGRRRLPPPPASASTAKAFGDWGLQVDLRLRRFGRRERRPAL